MRVQRFQIQQHSSNHQEGGQRGKKYKRLTKNLNNHNNKRTPNIRSNRTFVHNGPLPSLDQFYHMCKQTIMLSLTYDNGIYSSTLHCHTAYFKRITTLTYKDPLSCTRKPRLIMLTCRSGGRQRQTSYIWSLKPLLSISSDSSCNKININASNQQSHP